MASSSYFYAIHVDPEARSNPVNTSTPELLYYKAVIRRAKLKSVVPPSQFTSLFYKHEGSRIKSMPRRLGYNDDPHLGSLI